RRTSSCTVSNGSFSSGYAAVGTGCVPKGALNSPAAESGTFVVIHGGPTGVFVRSSSGCSERSRLVPPCTTTSARNESVCAGQMTGASVRRCEPVTSKAVVPVGSGGCGHTCSGGGGVHALGARLKSTCASQMSLGEEMPSNHGSSWSTGLLYQASNERFLSSGASDV